MPIEHTNTTAGGAEFRPETLRFFPHCLAAMPGAAETGSFLAEAARGAATTGSFLAEAVRGRWELDHP